MTRLSFAFASALIATMVVAGAVPALAHGQAYPGAPYAQVPYGHPGYTMPVSSQGVPDPEMLRMMERCRVSARDNHVGGALIGGAVGGLVGNRIAGGDRIVGTVAGAAVGAVAGAAIDKAEDKGRDRECEEFFRRNGPPSGYADSAAYAGYAPGYGYMMVPVMITTPGKPCVETTTVTEEWVDAPVRRRYMPRRAVIHDKRIKEKRVYTGS